MSEALVNAKKLLREAQLQVRIAATDGRNGDLEEVSAHISRATELIEDTLRLRKDVDVASFRRH